MSDRILITGASGFIGRNLVGSIRHWKPNPRVFTAGRRAGGDGLTHHAVDLLNPQQVLELVKVIQPDFIFHLMAVPKAMSLHEHYTCNTAPGIFLLEAAFKACPHVRVVFVGSAAEYGRAEKLPVAEDSPLEPISPYGMAKSWQTAAARYYAQRGVSVVMARLFNVLGPGVPEYLAPGSFAHQLKAQTGQRSARLTVGNLNCQRDFVDVRDVCQALFDLADRGVSGEAYNVCTGRMVTMKHVLERMIALSGLDAEVIVNSQSMGPFEVPNICGDNAKLFRLSGWSPVHDLEQSIAATLRTDFGKN